MENKRIRNSPVTPRGKSPPARAHQHLNPRHQTVLCRVVRVIFAGDLDDGGEGCLVGVHLVPYPVCDLECPETLAVWGAWGIVETEAVWIGKGWREGGVLRMRRDDSGKGGLPHMLVDENDADILPREREVLKGLLDLRRLRLGVNNKEVSLGRRAGGHMLQGRPPR